MSAESQKRLSWLEHSMETGRFFLRLLYTGTVCEVDWDVSKCGSQAMLLIEDVRQQVPIHILLGAFSIAKMYLVTPLLGDLVQALKRRLSAKTFDAICAVAIEMDSTPLRFHCMEYAKNCRETLLWSGGDAQREGNAATGNGLVGFNRIDAMGIDRKSTLMSFTIGSKLSLTINGEGHEGSVQKKPCENSHGEICFQTNAQYVDNIHDGTFKLTVSHGDDIFELFRAGSLSSQVQMELEGLFDERFAKRRRRKM